MPLKYLWSAYNSLLMLYGGDVFPQDDLSIVGVASLGLAGAFVQANLFGELAGFVYELMRNDDMLAKKVDMANTSL